MRSSFYAVVLNGEVSRFFSTKSAAVKFGRWMTKFGEVRVMLGGQGGMEVATFKAAA